MALQDYFQVRSKVILGVEIKVEMYIAATWCDTKKLRPFKSVCASKEKAIHLINAYKQVVMEENYIPYVAADFLCDYFGINKQGKTIEEVATEIKTIAKKRMEEAEHE